MIVISANKALIGGRVIDGAIHEVDMSGLLGEYQKLSDCDSS